MSDNAEKSQGTTVWIGTTASDESGDTFVQIKDVKTIGELGVESAILDATALEDAGKTKKKGMADYGNLDIGGQSVPDDAGQDALLDAAEDDGDDPYNFRVIRPSGKAYKFKAIVPKMRTNIGGVDGIIMFAAQLAITGVVTPYTAS